MIGPPVCRRSRTTGTPRPGRSVLAVRLARSEEEGSGWPGAGAGTGYFRWRLLRSSMSTDIMPRCRSVAGRRRVPTTRTAFPNRPRSAATMAAGAAVAMFRWELTEDGLETDFAVNHLAPFVL